MDGPRPPARPPLPADLAARLAAIVGDRYVVTDANDMAGYLVEWRGLFRGRAAAVVRPGSTREVAEVLAYANREGVAVVPQGGNTSLVGGSIPFERGDEIVLSLTRLDRVREVDPLSDTMTVEAGVTLLRAQQAAESADRLFPLSLASEGACTIGGNLGSNAGGTAVLAYGNARELVLGLEVVLADGRVWNGLGKLRKDNTGYDLRHLFIGSEGTLGVITAAVLKLFPRPRSVVTSFCGVPSPRAALDLLAAAKAHVGSAVTTFELIPRFGVDTVVTHMGCRDPLAGRHAWYVLMEWSSPSDPGLQERCETLLAASIEAGTVEDATVAVSLDQRDALWRVREALSEAQGFEGGSIKHDISLPVARVPEFIEEVNEALSRLVPGCRPMPFGHLGDGNLHFNVTQPVGADKAAFLARWGEVNELVHGYVARYGGSISAEHGIGRLKRDLLPRFKDPVAMDLMRALKATLDPNSILNPGKVL
ncbi:FAD-binding oxidoreductase [Alsobacter sp. SYSU M60028]|uniref:FAD-binding oxidoreductase n=1 Tax=Alsobacter ponti TaxID=2962936 RepID=A0ABT1LC14_9HYPH|nr:FAD-binding oxidoreductase [Alsobacter ponti]MCP8939045.1 FAD-binding oxidoreductase [Alsobacter ponti]